jgi:hypothetical protein
METWDERKRREERESRLQPGWIVELGGKEYVVDYVNESRAYCLPVGRREVEVPTEEVDEETGETVKRKFSARERGVNIAPNAMVKILRKEEPMAKRVCVICGKALHHDNKGDAHRACRKTNPAEVAVEREERQILADAAAETTKEVGDTGTTAATAATSTAAAEAEPQQQKEKPVAKKSAKTKKAAKPAEGRKVNSYELAAKTPKEGEFREGSQIAAVYKAVGDIGVATAAEVVKRIQGKVQTKGDLGANVAFYLSKLKGAGFIKVSR